MDQALASCQNMVEVNKEKKESDLSRELTEYVENPQSFLKVLQDNHRTEDATFVSNVCSLSNLLPVSCDLLFPSS